MLLADQEADGAGPPAGAVHALAEVEQRVRRPPVAHLVVEPGQDDVVALAERAVVVHQELGDDEQRDALHAGRTAGDLGQHQVDDVLGQLVVAAGDPHLVAGQPVAAVVLGLGPRGDVGQRRAGLRLRQRHRAEPAALELRSHVGVDLLLAAVGEQQPRVAHGEERVGRRADVGRLEPGEHRLPDGVRQLHAAVLLVEGAGHQPGVGEHLQRLGHLRDQLDLAVDHPRLVLVGLAVVRREVLGGDLLGEVEDRVEGLAGVLGEPRALGQRLHVEPLVQQEVEVAAGQDQRGTHAARVGRTSPRPPGLVSTRPRTICGQASDLGIQVVGGSLDRLVFVHVFGQFG